MRAVSRRSLTFAVALAVLLPGWAAAQAPTPPGSEQRLEAVAVDALITPPPAEAPIEELTVRAQRSLQRYRLEVEEAREEIIEAFNEANAEDDYDLTCRNEQPTGSRMPRRVCRPNVSEDVEARASRDFLRSLVMGTGRSTLPQAGTDKPNAEVVTINANTRAMVEEEMKKLMARNRRLYQSVLKYIEVKDEYDTARGAASQ